MAQHAQKGIAFSHIDYFNVMVIGITGQGKSTATNKVLVTLVPDSGEKFELKDFTLWSINESKKLRT